MPDTPRYLFNDFLAFAEPGLSRLPFTEGVFLPGEALWDLGEGVYCIDVITRGIVSVSVVHEKGYRKLLYLMGPESVFPGPHLHDFKIERSIQAVAVTETHTRRYDRDDFHKAVINSPELASAVIELYASWINLHIFESAHQSFNSLETKLCNLLYLLSEESESGDGVIRISRSELADILCTSRESLSRKLNQLASRGLLNLSRNAIAVVDRNGLAQLCSYEALD